MCRISYNYLDFERIKGTFLFTEIILEYIDFFDIDAIARSQPHLSPNTVWKLLINKSLLSAVMCQALF